MPAVVVLALLSWSARTPAAPRTFVPDYTFAGSALTGWSSLGSAEWKASNGEIVGRPTAGNGGWLVLNQSFQDVGVFAQFRCDAGCKTGLLFRAEKTPNGGMRGVFISLNSGDVSTYRVVLDPQGRELTREKLGPPSRVRTDLVTYMYPPRVVPADAPPAPAVGKDFPPAPRTIDLLPAIPHSRPAGSLKSGDWNELEVFVDARTTRTILNEGPLASADGEMVDEVGRYGPVALFVGGTGEVRFKDFALKDLNRRTIPAETNSSRFRMQRLDEFYYAWSAAIADVNRDGVMDVLTGPLYYLGPAYTEAREIYLAESYDGATQYARGCMVSFAHDFTGDGWPDQWCATGNNGQGPGVLFVNPKGEARRWDRHVVTPDVWIEETLLRDFDGDGNAELLMGVPGGTIVMAKPDPAAATKPWLLTPISEPGPWGANSAHGIGAGDINGDGRLDIVTAFGWWEHPPLGSSQKLWTHHPVALGRWGKSQGGPGGAEMAVYDVNGDGLNDVVTSLEAHGWGLAWFEQKKAANGAISFVRHMIMDNFQTKNAGDITFTELHGSGAGDIDGDGLTDFIVGKRHYSHLNSYSDPDPHGPAVLYWYRLVRNPRAPGGAEFVPELIHNRSGVGSHIVVSDVNKDGSVDIVTSTTKGSYIFWGRGGQK
jgi:hypothetical protein